MALRKQQWMLLRGFLVATLFLTSLAFGNSPVERSQSLSLVTMLPLLDLEWKLIENLNNYTKALELKLHIVRSHIDVMRAENEKGRLDPIAYLSNPLNGFSLIRRLYQDWSKWRKYMEQPVGILQIQNLDNLLVELPSKLDLWDACAGIIRIQSTYNLGIGDFISGKLDGKQYNVSMSSADIFAVGQHFVEEKSSWEAIQWLQEVPRHLKNELLPQHLAIGEVEVLKLLAEMHVNQKNYVEALSLLDNCLKLKPHDAALLRLRLKTLCFIERQQTPVLNENKPLKTPFVEEYKLSCRGISERPSRLHCFYNFTTTPFLRLAPLKTEQIGLDPYIVLYHEVLSKREMSLLISRASRKMKVATIYKSNTKNKKKKGRTAKGHWFNKENNELTRRISRRIHDMTGFDLTDSEEFQVINYGIGGHFHTHSDYFNFASANFTGHRNRQATVLGDRIATVLFYLTDVEQGGATVFEKTGYAVYPRAGTAIFWFNLNTNGYGDPRTRHAACPVIVGSKWVMTEWIREWRQMFIRPCLPRATGTSSKLNRTKS
ncbi:prolyl 4-hydroxylase subunit alpha-2-like [Drosophila elegans]|uniref:prolyl 4-hydroxylase subunit alpha-2-like n=1 Tax=Drosophila elegans TaxID=30023 RepID=UPI001BC863A8|nr:prolyl 4-hydroxylase subunit alpha-2-like [Drosophila elegans]